MPKKQVEEQNDLQERIVAQWKAFARTDAYKDWIKSMDEYMSLIQDNVDNMTESRPTGFKEVFGRLTPQMAKAPIDPVQAALMNQRKVGVRFCTEYAKLRVDS